MDGVAWTKAKALTGTMLITWGIKLLERADGTTPVDWLSG
jgi:hypothetical protein